MAPVWHEANFGSYRMIFKMETFFFYLVVTIDSYVMYV